MKKYIIAASLLVAVFAPTLNAMDIKKESYLLSHLKKNHVINDNVIGVQRAEGDSIAAKMVAWVLCASMITLWSAAFTGGLSVAHSPGTINPILEDPISVICFSPAPFLYVPMWFYLGIMIFADRT